METEELIRLLASRFIDMTPEKRLDAIEDLKSMTDFCWECGYDYGVRTVCHCRNDE